MYGCGICLIGTLGAMATGMFLKEYQIMRLIVFLEPNVDPQGAGWNLIQSVTAVGSGGFWGKGFLRGTQSHFRFLPQQSTDFIFSILAEEWGFAGALLRLPPLPGDPLPRGAHPLQRARRIRHLHRGGDRGR